MSRLIDVKRITVEEFAAEDRPLIEKIAFPINSFFEQVRNALNKNIDFNNLNQEIIKLDVIVESNGVPNTLTRFKSNLKTGVQGLICIAAINRSNASTRPTGAPFITFAQNENLVTIQHITGLQSGEKYGLTLISIG